MVLNRCVTVEGNQYTVVISDEQRALLDGQASGRALLGIWDKEKENQDLGPASYVVESIEDMTQDLLERVVRRHLKLPWLICETQNLMVRELVLEDCARMEETIFQNPELLCSYIENQYSFYEYGMWAVLEKSTGRVIGIAGITNLESDMGQELGYHIFKEWRRKGYAREACTAILEYAEEYLDIKTLYTRIDPSNKASIRLAESLGFVKIPALRIQKNSEAKQYYCRGES